MERRAYLEWSLARFTVTGLVVGTTVGLIEVLMLVVVDLATDWTPSGLLYLVMICGGLGLLFGLDLGLLLRDRPAAQDRVCAAEKERKGRWSHLGRNLAQGMGAGLIAGAVVGLVEVVGLVIVDQSLRPLTGLLYATIAYGVLGLLGALGLGLLRGLWRAWRDRDGDLTGHSAWGTFATLIVSGGAFLAVHNRVRRDVLNIPLRYVSLGESLLVDSLLLASTIALGIGLWFLLQRLSRRAWLVRFRWNAGLYLASLAVAVLFSWIAGFTATPANPSLPPASIPSDLRDKPNIIFIVAETTRADRLDCYAQRPVDGYDRHLTPHLDALAQDGVLYRNTSAQAAWTKPSVASMLASLYPSSHRATTAEAILSDEVVTLPEILAAAGYRTAGFTTNVQTAPQFNFQQGYDEYTFLCAEPPFFAFDTPIAMRFAVFRVFSRLRAMFQPYTTLPHEEIYADAEVVNQHALAWLEANKDTRFFLFLHYFDPHDFYFAHPYDGTSVSSVETPDPDPAQVDYIRQLYDGEVAFLDAHLGALFDQLKAWGLYDDTLIVFVSDHGEEFYEHGGWWHSETLYEELLAVPLIIKYPDNAYAGTVDEEFTQSLDIAPTVLDVLGLPVPETMQGVNLRPGAAVTRTEYLFAELDQIGTIRSIRNRRYKLITANPGNPRDLPLVALFDLQADPGEQRNLAQEDLGTVRVLRMELDRVMVFAEAHAVAGQSRELDVETQERLRQLGY